MSIFESLKGLGEKVRETLKPTTELPIGNWIIRSDKNVRKVTDKRVTFADGSYCDLATGDVVNKGDGYITCESIESTEAKLVTRGPEKFAATNLDVGGLRADVVIVPTESNEMSVTIEGAESAVASILLNHTDSILHITAEESAHSDDIFSVSVSGDFSIMGKSINIGNKPKTKVTIEVPIGSAIYIDEISGDVTIGDTEGSLNATARSIHNITVGAVTDAELKTTGVGSIEVESISGELSMKSSSVGSIRVIGGTASATSAKSTGVGSINFGGIAKDAELKASSPGKIYIAEAVGSLDMKVSGVGGITVSSGEVTSLTAKTSGVGNIRFAGNCETADLATSGVGGIHVAHVRDKPTTKESGLGKITIGE